MRRGVRRPERAGLERPPQLWEADTDDERFIPLLGEMIAASLSRGGKLEELAARVLEAATRIVPGHGPAFDVTADTPR